MPTFKKIAFTLFVLTALGFGIWGYFQIKNTKKPTLDALALLPDSCVMYFSTTKFLELNKKINSQSLIVDKLKDFDEIASFCKSLQHFDSLIKTNSYLQEEVENTKLHFAIYESHLNWLLTFNIQELGSEQSVLKELSQVLNASPLENGVFQFSIEASEKLFFNLNSGVVLLTNRLENIPLALNNFTPKLKNNPTFISFQSAIEESGLLSIFINQKLYCQSLSAKKINTALLFTQGFLSGKIDIQPSQLIINGYLKPEGNELISTLSKQAPQAPDFLDALPFNTSSFKAFGFESYTKLKKESAMFSKNLNSSFWKSANDSAMFNLENAFYENVDNILIGFETFMPKQKYITTRIIDTTLFKEQLAFMSDTVSSEGALTFYHLNTRQESLRLFEPFVSTSASYACLYNSFLYLAESKAQLLDLLGNLKSKLVMTNSESFLSFKNQNFSEKFNLIIYNSPNQLKEELPQFFNFKSKAETNSFQNFKHFLFTLTFNNNQFKYRCLLNNEPESINNSKQPALWTIKLDSTSNKKVNSFTNHLTGETELVTQDNANNLYLLNAKGSILWKKKINESVESQIFTVDIFKNNKYQMLFSTKNYLHLIDRNGKYVEGYPVKLAAEASNPLSLFDYDQDKNYRLFIACKNKTIYNYSIYGIKQEGFVSLKTENEITLPIQYVNVGESDYLVAVDVEGLIYTFSRKGLARIGLKNKVVENCSSFYVDATTNINTTNLIYIDDKNSSINKISFSDKKELIPLNSDIKEATIKFNQINSAKNTDVIISTSTSILAFNFNGNLLFENKTESDLSKANYFSDDNHSFFYAWSAAKQKLVLFDQLSQKTKIFEATAMPLIINIFKDNKSYFILPHGNQINCIPVN